MTPVAAPILTGTCVESAVPAADAAIMHREAEHVDEGFTLVELLIVIVILGILSTVTVFAVRGITDQGQASACATDFRAIQTAQSAHYGLEGSYASEADLVGNGMLASESDLFDTSVTGGDYTITATGTTCTESGGSAGGTPAATTAAVPGSQSAPTSITFAGVPAQRYGGTGADEILVFGRAEGAADWAATTGVGMDVTRRVTFMDIDDVATYADLRDAIIRANNTPPTSYALYGDDDTTPFGGYPSFRDAFDDVLTDPQFAGPVYDVDADGTQNLAWVFLRYP
ncbi:MAG: type II secretion system protein [Actinomycetota bacterium]